jgi:hypothetical protein
MFDNIFGHLVQSNFDGWVNQLEELEIVDHSCYQPLHSLLIRGLSLYLLKVAKSTLHIKNVYLESSQSQNVEFAQSVDLVSK